MRVRVRVRSTFVVQAPRLPLLLPLLVVLIPRQHARRVLLGPALCAEASGVGGGGGGVGGGNVRVGRGWGVRTRLVGGAQGWMQREGDTWSGRERGRCAWAGPARCAGPTSAACSMLAAGRSRGQSRLRGRRRRRRRPGLRLYRLPGVAEAVGAPPSAAMATVALGPGPRAVTAVARQEQYLLSQSAAHRPAASRDPVHRTVEAKGGAATAERARPEEGNRATARRVERGRGRRVVAGHGERHGETSGAHDPVHDAAAAHPRSSRRCRGSSAPSLESKVWPIQGWVRCFPTVPAAFNGPALLAKICGGLGPPARLTAPHTPRPPLPHAPPSALASPGVAAGSWSSPPSSPRNGYPVTSPLPLKTLSPGAKNGGWEPI